LGTDDGWLDGREGCKIRGEEEKHCDNGKKEMERERERAAGIGRSKAR